MRTALNRVGIWLLLPVLVFSQLFGMFLSPAASASPFSEASKDQKLAMYTYAQAMVACFTLSGLHNGAEEGEVGGGNLFSPGTANNGRAVVYIYDDALASQAQGNDNGRVGCHDNNNALAKAFYSTFNISDSSQIVNFICDGLGYKSKSGVDLCEAGGPVDNSAVQAPDRDTLIKNFKSYIARTYGFSVDSPGHEVSYSYFSSVLVGGCGLVGLPTGFGNTESKKQYNLKGLVGGRSQTLKYGGSEDRNYAVPLVGKDANNKTGFSDYLQTGFWQFVPVVGAFNLFDVRNTGKTCKDLEVAANKAFDGLFDELKKEAQEWCKSPDGGDYRDTDEINACVYGVLGKGDTTDNCTLFTLGDPTREACGVGRTNDTVDTGSAESKFELVDNETGQGCSIAAIGWLVCPIVEKMADVTDGLYGYIENILVLDPLETTQVNGDDTPQYSVWKAIRDIANVLLVIAFIIIIFSQLTGLFVTNYGIKKMLPRIILVAIAVNLSFFVMMLSIDLANLLGKGVYDMINTLAEGALNVDIDWGDLIQAIYTGAIGVQIGAATGLLLTLGFVANLEVLMLIMIPFLVGALAAVALAFITLFLRNALIIVLTILSPVAFAAFLLPNTQSLFDKWRKLIVGLLLLYPTAALLFSGAKLAGNILISGEEVETINVIFALFVMMAPLFMLPWLARQGGPALAKVNDKFGQWRNSLQSATKRGLEPRVQRARARYATGRTNFLGRNRERSLDRFNEEKERLRREKEGLKGNRSNAATARRTAIDRRSAALDRQIGMETNRLSRSRTLGQISSAGRKNVEEETKGLQSREQEQWKRLGTDGPTETSRQARASSRIQGSSELTGVQAQATEARRKELLSERINTTGSLESAEFGERRGSEVLTVKHEKQAEAKFQDRIKGSSGQQGGLYEAIQDTKDAEYNIKVREGEQEGTFKLRQGIAAKSPTARRRDSKLQTLEDLRVDENVATKKSDAGQELVKSAGSVDLENNRDNLQFWTNRAGDAKDRTALAEQRENTRLDERAAQDADLVRVRNFTTASKRAQDTAQADISKQYAEAALDRGSDVNIEATGNVDRETGQLRAEAYAEQVVEGQKAEDVKAVSAVSTAKAASANQTGVRYEGTKLIYDDANGHYEYDYAPGAVNDPTQQEVIRKQLEDGKVIPFAGTLDDFAEPDRDSLHTIQDYNSYAGALATAESILSSGDATSDGLKRLVEGVPLDERPSLVSAINKAAKSAGHDWAASAKVNDAGEYVIGGMKASPEMVSAIPGGPINVEAGFNKVAQEVVDKGAPAFSKTVLSDRTVGSLVGQKLRYQLDQAREAAKNNDFTKVRELAAKFAGAGDDKLPFFIRAMYPPGTVYAPGKAPINHNGSPASIEQTEPYKWLRWLRQVSAEQVPAGSTEPPANRPRDWQ